MLRVFLIYLFKYPNGAEPRLRSMTRRADRQAACGRIFQLRSAAARPAKLTYHDNDIILI
jgi:hypothetical protein